MRRTLLVVGVYMLAWAVLDLVAMQFQAARDVSLWYPPPALDLFLLLVFGLRYTPVLLVNALVHDALVNPVGLNAWQVLAFAAVTTAGYAGAVLVLLRVLRVDPRLPTQRDVGALVVVACGAAALLVAGVQVSLLCAAGVVPWAEFPFSVAGHWAGAATGIAMLTPVLLLAARRWPGTVGGWPEPWTQHPPLPAEPPGLRPRWWEVAAQLVTLLAAVYAAYARGSGSLDYTYLIYAPLVWIAVRGGLRLTASAVLVANVAAVALNGGRVPGDGGIALQFGLVTLTLTGLLLGALVTQRRADEARHRHAALHDALTGLANRVLFTDRIEQAAARAAREPQRRFAVLFCDLDNFKQINDSLGHQAGDQVLVEVAHRLRSVTRPTDSLARLGGDEFAVLLDGLPDPEELERITGRMLSTLAEPHTLPGTAAVVVQASIGSTLNRPGQRHAAADLLRDADLALHQAKHDGRNRHLRFDSGMRAHALTGLQRESELRRALQDRQVQVAFQPVLALDDLRVVGAEALARWTAPNGQPADPAQFIDLAERTGLIVPLGEQVLRQACAHAAGWWGPAGSERRLAVNVSPRELSSPGYAERVLGVLADSGLAPAQLDLEITETQWLAHSDVVQQVLAALTGRGVGLLVDDFGTGYSSFTYLHELPVTGLKIDRSFVAGLPHHRQHATIVKSILAMAAELGLPVTAEGIQTAEQLEFLRRHRCPRGQGHLLGQPAPLLPGPRTPADGTGQPAAVPGTQR